MERRSPSLNEKRSCCKNLFCFFFVFFQRYVSPLTQGRGAEEDSSWRLPPSSSSSSVFYLLSLLHGSQLLTRLIVVHQPEPSNTHTHTKRMSLNRGIKGKLLMLCVRSGSTCQRRASDRPRGTPCRRRSSRRTSPPSSPRLFG